MSDPLIDLLRDRPFELPDLPGEGPTAEELLEQRGRAYTRKAAAADARRLIPIKINIDGPIGLALFGDPHVDDDGTDIAALQRDVAIVNRTPGLLAGNVGDYRNNWIGRLARLWGEQSTSARDARVLAEWLLKACPWLFLVGGNHDAWSGADDPVEWIAAQVNALHQPFQCRIALQFPNGKQVRVNARHDFTGNSIYNTAHGVMRAAKFGWRDQVLVCGHRHVSGYGLEKDPSTGLISHCIRVASYKTHDRHAIASGFPDLTVFVCPVIIIDPRYEDHDPRLITTIFDTEEGGEYLTWKRARAGFTA